MIKSIRRCVFETNSSSTHSISIYRWTPTMEKSIPLNSILEVDGAISTQTEIKDELGKLNYIIAILASIASQRYYEDKIEKLGFEDLINTSHFVWLKEVIEDKTNTRISYIAQNNIFPYFETTYDEGNNIENILGCNMEDKKDFKLRVAEIIFDENYIIEDKEDEY